MRNTNFKSSAIYLCGKVRAPNILSRKKTVSRETKYTFSPSHCLPFMQFFWPCRSSYNRDKSSFQIRILMLENIGCIAVRNKALISIVDLS